MMVSLRALVGKLNEAARSALDGAAGLCMSRTHYDIELQHYLLKLLDISDCDFSLVIKHFKVDSPRMVSDLMASLDTLKSGNSRTPAFSPHLVALLGDAWLIGSIDFDASQIRTGFIMMALLADPGRFRLAGEATAEIRKINVDELRQRFLQIVSGSTENPATTAATSSTESVSARRQGAPRVFISYRKQETSTLADWLVDRIRAQVRDIEVWRDVDTLKPGVVFSDAIEEGIGACDIVLALIGKRWLTTTDKGGRRRIDDERDWVRMELAAAFRQKKYVIPCLVGEATMPGAEELPPDLAELASRHGLKIAQSTLRRDSVALIELLQQFRPIAE
jgi:hypothetical protein